MRSLPVLVWKEEGAYVSRCPVTSVSSYGDTETDAINNHREAMELFLEDLSREETDEIGASIPSPDNITLKTVSLNGKKS